MSYLCTLAHHCVQEKCFSDILCVRCERFYVMELLVCLSKQICWITTDSSRLWKRLSTSWLHVLSMLADDIKCIHMPVVCFLCYPDKPKQQLCRSVWQELQALRGKSLHGFSGASYVRERVLISQGGGCTGGDLQGKAIKTTLLDNANVGQVFQS